MIPALNFENVRAVSKKEKWSVPALTDVHPRAVLRVSASPRLRVKNDFTTHVCGLRVKNNFTNHGCGLRVKNDFTNRVCRLRVSARYSRITPTTRIL